jgi:uncharacterized protein YbcI
LEEEVLKNAFRWIIQAKKIAQNQPEQLKSNRMPIGVSHNRSEIKRTNQDTDRDNSKRDPNLIEKILRERVLRMASDSTKDKGNESSLVD